MGWLLVCVPVGVLLLVVGRFLVFVDICFLHALLWLWIVELQNVVQQFRLWCVHEDFGNVRVDVLHQIVVHFASSGISSL